MKKIFLLLLIVSSLFTAVFAQKQVKYSDYFTDNSMRIDYYLTTGHDTIISAIAQIKKEPYWAGTRTYLLDPFHYGYYRIIVTDSATGKVIYTNGYNSLSEEWLREQRSKYVFKTFYEAVNIPYPKKTVRFKLLYRDKHNHFHLVIDTCINPHYYKIVQEQPPHFKTVNLLINGDPSHKVDLVFIPEGYGFGQMQQFINDAKRLVNALFSYKPFSEHKKDFNIRLILVPSPQSGTDIPSQHIWKVTMFDSHFSTFGAERYLTLNNYKTLKDIAAQVPYDQIVVLVNTKHYGGGGFYNFYNIQAAENPRATKIFVHEFGHSFASLADEYVDPSMQNYYDTTVEPFEPNITTLVNFGKKWKDMVADTVPIPTPATAKYKNVVGAFEGAGYASKGIYRPQQHCLMRSLAYPYCKVCQRAITRMIEYYTK